MKKIAKIFALAMSVMMLCAAFAGCGDKENTIIYGTSADYAPYEFHILQDGKDTIVGYDVSLAKFIAEEAKMEMEIKDIGFDFLIQELKNGTIDMVIAAMEEDAERAKEADFSDPYYLDEPPMILVRKADTANFTTIADFSGKTVGAQAATTKEDLVTSDMEGAKLLSLTTVPDLVNN
ncbi:MAG: transporter substrate-binding domain-containing protein, partial [Clostridia bacterium]|nr:transporter substrate-binding domain-containing protein [Clostridia bacterium]